MDISTIIGLVVGTTLVIGAILIGGSIVPFYSTSALMITVGGSVAAVLINFPLKSVLSMFRVVRKCFVSRLPSVEETLEQFTQLAAVARRDGFMALEQQVEEIDDEFMVRGLEMVIGGAAKEDIVSALEAEITYVGLRHQNGKKILDSMAAAAPAFGMIGTLIGLVQMLRTLTDPRFIGEGMATALLTTLYGAFIANLICIPLAGKLEVRSQEEITLREVMLSGLESLVEGLPPRQVRERLLSFLSVSSRAASS